MVFRYPGAKTKLLVPIRARIDPILHGRNEFHDVFVGGGSVLCSVAKSHPYIKLFANDLDKSMAEFWTLMSEPQGQVHEKFFSLIKQKPTIDLFNRLRSTPALDRAEHAYYAVFFNRTTFSGISTSGPIGGQAQRTRAGVGDGKTYTVDCRYNAKRIEAGVLEMIAYSPAG